MKIKLEPINDTNRKAVLALTVREDQPFVAQNDYSLSEADEANARAPGTARPFAICAGETIFLKTSSCCAISFIQIFNYQLRKWAPMTQFGNKYSAFTLISRD